MEIYLNSNAAVNLLDQWRPWTLLKTIIGSPIDNNVKSVSLSVETSFKAEDQSVLPVNARINFD